ncbi:hypothetical protein [Streptomyces sp. NPDC055107]
MRTDWYTVLPTIAIAVQGANRAIGAWNHHPLNAHAAIAAPAAFSDWTSVSRSGPASTHALRTDRRTSAHS